MPYVVKVSYFINGNIGFFRVRILSYDLELSEIVLIDTAFKKTNQNFYSSGKRLGNKIYWDLIYSYLAIKLRIYGITFCLCEDKNVCLESGRYLTFSNEEGKGSLLAEDESYWLAKGVRDGMEILAKKKN